jgi:hypothetical protein
MQLPKIFGGKEMRDDNVTPLRDMEPTRPHRFQHDPQPPPMPANQKWPSGSYGPLTPPDPTSAEMDLARAIADRLMPLNDAARLRVVQHVEFMVKIYGKKHDEPPEVNGAPV